MCFVLQVPRIFVVVLAWEGGGGRAPCGGVVVKALRYYSDDPGIDSQWCHWVFSDTFLPAVPWPWSRLSP